MSKRQRQRARDGCGKRKRTKAVQVSKSVARSGARQSTPKKECEKTNVLRNFRPLAGARQWATNEADAGTAASAGKKNTVRKKNYIIIGNNRQPARNHADADTADTAKPEKPVRKKSLHKCSRAPGIRHETVPCRDFRFWRALAGPPSETAESFLHSFTSFPFTSTHLVVVSSTHLASSPPYVVSNSQCSCTSAKARHRHRRTRKPGDVVGPRVRCPRCRVPSQHSRQLAAAVSKASATSSHVQLVLHDVGCPRSTQPASRQLSIAFDRLASPPSPFLTRHYRLQHVRHQLRVTSQHSALLHARLLSPLIISPARHLCL